MVSVAEADDVIAQSRALIAEGHVRRERWAALVVGVREDRGARAFAGASDTADVANLIVDRPMCLPCLMRKSGLTALRVTELLTGFVRVMQVRVDEGRCDGCGKTTIVHAIA